MLFDNFDFPNKEERELIYKSCEHFQELCLTVDCEDNSDTTYIDIIENRMLFEHWISQFNRKIGEVRISYILLTHYFNKCSAFLKDAINANEEGEEYNSNKYIFYFYADVFYHKAFSTWDFIYHLINIYYKLNILTKSGFNDKVMKKLKCINTGLYSKLDDVCCNNDVFKEAKRFRNDLTHNFPPINATYIINKSNDGVTTLSVKPSIEPEDFIGNAKGLFGLFFDTLVVIKREFEKDLSRVKMINRE